MMTCRDGDVVDEEVCQLDIHSLISRHFLCIPLESSVIPL